MCAYNCLLKIFNTDVYGAVGSQVSILLIAGPLLSVLILRSEILRQIIQSCSSKSYPYVVSLSKNVRRGRNPDE